MYGASLSLLRESRTDSLRETVGSVALVAPWTPNKFEQNNSITLQYKKQGFSPLLNFITYSLSSSLSHHAYL